MPFCGSCGKQKRLRWPRHRPVYCSMSCAANAFAAYASIGGWEGSYCGGCGVNDAEYHELDCPYAVEGWDKPYSDSEECHGGSDVKEADTW